MNDVIVAFLILFGTYDVDWIYVEVDVPELTDPKYGYQN